MTNVRDHHVRKGDRFVHVRQLDMYWEPGPGQKYADAPHAVMRVTWVTGVYVYYTLDSAPESSPGIWVVVLDNIDDVVREWLE